MTYANVADVSSLDLGKFLKIYSTNGVYNQLSDASEIWKYFLKLRARGAEGRRLQYLLRTSYGPGAVQSVPVSEGNYPAAQRSGLTEATAHYKDFALTVSVPRSVMGKTGNDLVQYADPLTEELDAKAIAAARVMSAQMMGDGTGVIGVISGTPTINTTTNIVTIVIKSTSATAGKSHIGWFMEDDKIKFANESSTSQATNGTSVSYYKVVDINAETDTITCTAWTSANVQVTDVTSANTLEDGDYIYRFGTTPGDLDGGEAISDYGLASECLAGLESLSADDGRTLHGLTMSGALAGSRKDCSAEQIDASHFQSALSKAKRRCGRSRYKYSNAFMFDTVYDALVESGEADRRFQMGQSTSRGVKSLGYQHQKDFVEFTPDEFTQKSRVWILPDSKDVLEMHGKDFQVVEPNKGQKFQLANASSGTGHSRTTLSYMEGSAVVIAKHPAAICALTNFAV